MDIAYIKQNASLAGRCDDDMHWYYLEGDLYIEGKDSLDLARKLVFDRFVPQEYSYEAQRSFPIKYPWEQVKDQIARVHIAEGSRLFTSKPLTGIKICGKHLFQKV